MTLIRRFAPKLLMAALLSASLPAAADSIDELRTLVDAGDNAAWDMAQRMEDEQAGDPDFDFYYGLAARAAGQPERAVFAFERVYVAYPGNQRIKLELARAYFENGNTVEAGRLFNEVLAAAPPEPVERAVRTYMDAIAASGSGQSTTVGGTLSLAFGHDSNINSGPGTQLTNMLGIPLTLLPGSGERSSVFADATASVDITSPTSRRTARFLHAEVHGRDNEELLSGGNFDYLDGTLSGGWLVESATTLWRFPLTLQSLHVESDEMRYVGTIGAEASRPLSARTALLGFGQLGAVQFPSQEERNTLLAMVGTGYVWSPAQAPVRLTTTAYVGTEPPQENGVDFAGRDYVAVRFATNWAPVDRHSLSFAVGGQLSAYQGPNTLQLEREELLVDAALGWQWLLAQDLSLDTDVSWAENASKDNTTFDYERIQGSVGVTWRY